MAQATIGISVPTQMAEQIEKHVDEHEYDSVSAMGRQALRNQMQADMGNHDNDD